MDVPNDIFTEPENVDPDTLANLGPLRHFAGIWEGKRGVDVNPKADGPETRNYYERVEMQPIDPQANGPQLFYGLRYHLHINTPEEDITFHDQVGYWLYEPATGLILQTLAIPRGQIAIAAGHAAPDARKLSVRAERGQTEYGICSTASRSQPLGEDRPRRQGKGDRLSGSALETANAFQIDAVQRFGKPQSAAAAARPAHDRLALQPVGQRQVQMAPALEMSAMDEARAALRHVDKLDDAFDPIDLRLGARVERDAGGAIAISALFGSKLFEHAGAVDLFVKGHAAAATVGPYDLALQHDTVGQIDVQIFVDMKGNVGRKLHAAVRNIAHAP